MGNKEAKPKKKSKREGRRVRSLDPMNYVSPYIMKTRNDSTNYIDDKFDVAKCDAFIKEKRAQGLTEFGYMHIIVAAYVRMLSQHPALNRFIRGQKIYARNNIDFMIVVKKEMKVNAPETCIKVEFPPEATIDLVYERINAAVETARNETSDFDSTAKLLNHVPGLFLKFAMWFINLLDYFGWLPKSLIKVSPFHSSFAITSMASLGIPPIYHHLYNFGTTPLFLAFGNKYTQYELQSDGSVQKRRFMDYKVTCDERIADGHAYSVGLRMLNHLVRNPELLEAPPEKVVEDIP